MFLLGTAFVICLLIWSATLWFIFSIDIFDYSLLSIIAMHLAPPTAITAIWFGIQRWHQARTQALTALAEEAKKEAQQAERATKKKVFEEELARRRIGVDCRWVAVADICEQNGIYTSVADTGQSLTRRYSVPLDDSNWPFDSLSQVLNELFSTLPFTTYLPVVVHQRQQDDASQLIELITRAHERALSLKQPPIDGADRTEVVAANFETTSIEKQLRELFQSHSDWPGAIAIAFDSHPKLGEEHGGWTEYFHDATETDELKWHGSLGRALIALVLTPANLDSVLDKLRSLNNQLPPQVMTPFWERQQIPFGIARSLSVMPEMWRDQLAATPVIATLHRAASCRLQDATASTQHVGELKRAITEAAIDSALLEPVSGFDEHSEQSLAPSAPPGCTWLTHNAGHISHCGNRISRLLSAMYQLGMELHPIEQATNTVHEFGNCGECTPWLLTALAIQRAVADGKPVMNAIFADTTLIIHFVTPPACGN